MSRLDFLYVFVLAVSCGPNVIRQMAQFGVDTSKLQCSSQTRGRLCVVWIELLLYICLSFCFGLYSSTPQFFYSQSVAVVVRPSAFGWQRN